MHDIMDSLSSSLKSLNLEVDDKKLDKLVRYISLLQKWNKAYNLTAIRDSASILERHIIDSLSIADFIDGNRFIDVGTGAGLPGIPLAIIFPEKQFTLLDSNGKKTRFLFQARIELGLDNIEIVNNRVEKFHDQQKFDGILSRAFTQLQDMVDKTSHLCKPGGCYLAMKGQLPEIELQAITKPYKVQTIDWPGNQSERHLITIVEKPV